MKCNLYSINQKTVEWNELYNNEILLNVFYVVANEVVLQ